MPIQSDIHGSSLEQDPLPVIALDGSAKPRFCRTCGTPWQIDWEQCLPCSANNSRAFAPPLTIASEWRAVKSSLFLYFSLLTVCAIGIGLSHDLGGVNLQLWLTAAISAITLGWCVGSLKTVWPPLTKLPEIRWFALAIGLSLISYGIAVGVIHGLNSLLHAPSDSMSKPFLKAGYGWPVIIAVICLQPALIEELAFRGVIFAALTKALSASETILVSAMMFMILHLSPGRFPHTLALGLSAGFLRYRTKSLYPCMLMHFSHNFLCIAGEWLAR